MAACGTGRIQVHTCPCGLSSRSRAPPRRRPSPPSSHQFLSQEDRHTDTKQTTPTRSPGPPKALHPQKAAAAPLGHAAGNRVRGADSLAQALDLLANHRGISHDRRLGDHARVMQKEVHRNSFNTRTADLQHPLTTDGSRTPVHTNSYHSVRRAVPSRMRATKVFLLLRIKYKYS